MIKYENILKEAGQSMALAVKDFITKNKIDKDKVNITVINDQTIIIRNHDESVLTLNNANKTIYHGASFDIFSFVPFTRTSGSLNFDEILTDEYRYKCEY